MSKLLQLKSLKGKQLYDFLKANRKELIAEKKSMIKRSDILVSNPLFVHEKKDGVLKADNNRPQTDTGELPVLVVCNSTLYCDNSMDVGIPGCYDKTCNERGSLIPHIADHDHTVKARVGKNTKTYPAQISLKRLGIDKDGEIQCLVQESTVVRDYDPKVYLLYMDNQINQHSIALQYIKLNLAIVDPTYPEENAYWNKWYSQIVNKDRVDEYGFFWGMEEIKVWENSCVLFADNELTPTLDVSESTKNQPPSGTGKQPPKSKASYDFKSIMQTLKK